MSLRDFYHEHGYVLLEQALPATLIDEHVRRVAEVYSQFGLDSMDAERERTFSNWRATPASFFRAMYGLHNDAAGLALSLHARLRDLVCAVLGEDVIRDGASTKFWGSEAPAHCDTLMVFRGPWPKVCRTWCALEDIHPDSGPFFVVPGSHRLRTQVPDEVLGENPELIAVLQLLALEEMTQEQFYERAKPLTDAARKRLAAQIEGLPRMSFPIRRGDVVLFSTDIQHGGLPVTDRTLTRKATIIEWHARSAETYLMNAYWGSRHDHRCSQNAYRYPPVIEHPAGAYRSPDPDRYALLNLNRAVLRAG